MTHFLEDLPLNFARVETQELWSILSHNYWDRTRLVTFIQEINLSPGSFQLAQPTDNLWRDLMIDARLKGKLKVLLEKVRADSAELAPRIDELLQAEPVTSPPGPDDTDDATEEWAGFDPTGGEERLIVEDHDSLLDIAFLTRGLELAPSVCRLYCVIGAKPSHGTGFRIGERTLLTNHHMMHNWKQGDAPATHAEAWFNFEVDWQKRPLVHDVVACDVTTIRGEKPYDWSVIQTSMPISDKYPIIPLAVPDPIPAKDDRVFIIQHPEGLPKKIGLDHNLVRFVDKDVIQYWTDTKVGSSGSPVFDATWQLVGLHHRWVEVSEGTKREYRNQGRRIDSVIARMDAMGVPL